MGDGEDGKNISRTTVMDTLLDISTNRVSRDLLQRFMGGGGGGGGGSSSSSSGNETVAVQEEDQEIELNLGLSLGGRFGVDKSSNKLVRSSSVAECLPVVRDDNDVVAPPSAVAYTGLLRTSSLPVETEEEWRKRKQLQTLRRMEAKRRRSEKQRNLKGDKERGGGGGGGGNLSREEKKEIEVNLRERLEREKSLAVVKRLGLPFRLSASAATSTDQAIRGGVDVAMFQRKGNYLGDSGGMQKSMESKGGRSSSLSEFDTKTFGGSSSGGEQGHGSIQSLREGTNQDVGASGTKARENTSRMTRPDTESLSTRSDAVRNRGREVGTNAVEDMPSVFTKGDGPKGRRVDGILYRYGKGEEVRIMCICHGNFLSPAEFVEHAGGSDADNPLKHIVVSSNSSSLL